MRISAQRPSSDIRRGAGLHAAGRRAAFKLKALGDLTSGIARARTFDESLRIALMVILGTFGVPKGILFLEEEEFLKARACRGLPPDVPPVAFPRELARSFRRARRPVRLRDRSVPRAVRRAASELEGAVPGLSARVACPLPGGEGEAGLLLLGPPIAGRDLRPGQMAALGIMTAILASHVAHHRAFSRIMTLNDLFRAQVKENVRLLGEMETIYLDTIRALAAAIDAKDPYTGGHSERVARLSVLIARRLGLPDREVQAIRIAAILHDVGKIGIDRALLRKGAPLNRAEVRAIRKHPRKSFDILSAVRFPYPDVALLAWRHHEKLDGSGYPDGMKGGQIPRGARVIAVADAFDAMVSARPYRPSLPLLDALRRIGGGARSQFDAEVVRAFFRVVRREIGGKAPKDLFLDAGNGKGRGEVLAYLGEALG